MIRIQRSPVDNGHFGHFPWLTAVLRFDCISLWRQNGIDISAPWRKCPYRDRKYRHGIDRHGIENLLFDFMLAMTTKTFYWRSFSKWKKTIWDKFTLEKHVDIENGLISVWYMEWKVEKVRFKFTCFVVIFSGWHL